MASLAVFRDLYNKKRDIYSVIAEFVKLAIAEKALSSFNLQQMVNIINQEYGFDLPVAVVKRALGKLSFHLRHKKAKNPIIRLRYFAENRDEIDAFFKIAERIVRKEEQLNPSKQAMCNIVNGCVDASEVVEKKAELFRMLSEKNITIDSQEHYYDKEVAQRGLSVADRSVKLS